MERTYQQLAKCDLDRSSDVSVEEFVVFCRRVSVSRESVMTKFFRADINGDGTSQTLSLEKYEQQPFTISTFDIATHEDVYQPLPRHSPV